MKREAEKTALSTIAVATAKAKEQEAVLRSREAMATRQEHIQVTHGKVTVLFQCGIHDNLLIPTSCKIPIITHTKYQPSCVGDTINHIYF